MWPLLLLGGVAALVLLDNKRSSETLEPQEPLEPKARRWPVEPYRGISNGFGAPRTVPGTDKPRYHAGVDVGAKQGDRVVAIDDGVVIQRVTGYELKAGLQGVSVSHPDADYIYAEIDLKVEPGQQVKAGDLIGIVRNNGTSNTSMLHLERWEKGKAPAGFTMWTPDYRPPGLLDAGNFLAELRQETGNVA